MRVSKASTKVVFPLPLAPVSREVSPPGVIFQTCSSKEPQLNSSIYCKRKPDLFSSVLNTPSCMLGELLFEVFQNFVVYSGLDDLFDPEFLFVVQFAVLDDLEKVEFFGPVDESVKVADKLYAAGILFKEKFGIFFYF